jgi:hypothetical protein
MVDRGQDRSPEDERHHDDDDRSRFSTPCEDQYHQAEQRREH